jgi:capsular exopolysaccharide synthesis family protein
MAYEESVDSLRVTLALCDEVGDAKVLVVASAVSGEGKSTLAARLAFSCAKGANEKVLLIDGDLRAPDQHKLFEIECDPGLGEVLLGERQLEEAIVDWGHGLHVIPAGCVAMSPHRLFSNGAYHQFMEVVRQRYDRVVIDVPPILAAGESLHIAKEADGVLFCARKDVSRMPQVKMACNRLELSGARILGCVFVGVKNGYYSE